MQQRRRPRPSSDTPTRQDGTAPLCLRNHDVERAYEVTVRAVNLDDREQVRRSYALRPGDLRRELGAFPPGRYNVAVTLDAGARETVTCRLSEHPADTVLVECGNGVLSVTTDPY